MLMFIGGWNRKIIVPQIYKLHDATSREFCDTSEKENWGKQTILSNTWQLLFIYNFISTDIPQHKKMMVCELFSRDTTLASWLPISIPKRCIAINLLILWFTSWKKLTKKFRKWNCVSIQEPEYVLRSFWKG